MHGNELGAEGKIHINYDPSYNSLTLTNQSYSIINNQRKKKNQIKQSYYKKNILHQQLAYHEMFRSLTFQRKGKTDELHEQFILVEKTSL